MTTKYKIWYMHQLGTKAFERVVPDPAMGQQILDYEEEDERMTTNYLSEALKSWYVGLATERISAMRDAGAGMAQAIEKFLEEEEDRYRRHLPSEDLLKDLERRLREKEGV